jgi:hypothetical protein
MKTVTNKTQKPLNLTLPRGKTLHLGPGKTGQISSKDGDHAGLQKLAAAGTIEILDEGARPGDGAAGGSKGRGADQGHSRGSGSRRSGDR